MHNTFHFKKIFDIGTISLVKNILHALQFYPTLSHLYNGDKQKSTLIFYHRH